MKYEIGKLVMEGVVGRGGEIIREEPAVRTSDGVFFLSNRLHDEEEGDTILVRYEPQDQFARLIRMDELQLKGE